MSTDEVTFESSDGLTLEAILDDPDEPRAALVLCHPHPKMGGTMNAPLLAALTARMTGRRMDRPPFQLQRHRQVGGRRDDRHR